ncbi:MAG: DNA primase [Eubacteriales bacterium]|nr:DNA primase [Eubacteriales bacterium]
MRFTDAWLDELRSRVDIVDVVSGYVPLKQKGRRFWGCCPFHNEKTPSFSVDSAAQLYYCFGCHKGGNVIHFVMEMDRLEFPDAVKELAERVNFALPVDTGGPREGVSREEKELIREANREAARFYHASLWQSEGAQALSYLHKRGLTDKQIRHFGLGSTAGGRDSCLKHLREKGYSDAILLKAGIATSRDGRLYDMFRDRAIFPIIDGQGYVLGFGGRILGSGEPKYLNTGDTPVFNKRRNLYAMNYVRKERGLKRIILAEGYMDVIALRCAGLEGVVATLGTALTEEQARLIKRLAPEVWISYDGDSAGRKAALRALDIFEQMDIPAKVVDYPAGMDPDDFIREHGAQGFEQLKPMSAPEYRMARAADDLDLSAEEARVSYAIRCCQILRRVKNPVEREGYLKRLEIQTGFTRGVLLEQMGVVASDAEQAKPARRIVKKEARGLEKYERMLLTLLAKGLIPRETVKTEDFSEGLARDMAKLLLEGVSPSSIPDRLSLEGEALADAVSALHEQMLPEDGEKALQFAQECLEKMRKDKLETVYDTLIQEYTNATEERRAALREQLVSIETERARLDRIGKYWL